MYGQPSAPGAEGYVDERRLKMEAELAAQFGVDALNEQNNQAAAAQFGFGGGNNNQPQQLIHLPEGGTVAESHSTLRKRTRIACIQDPSKRSLYQMITRQLAFDGYLHAAEAVATSTGVITPNLTNGGSRLSKLVKYGMAAEQVRRLDKARFECRNSAECALSEAALYVAPVDSASTPALKMVERFSTKTLDGVVRSCTFNPDGNFIAVAGTSRVGVRIFSVTDVDEYAARHQIKHGVTSEGGDDNRAPHQRRNKHSGGGEGSAFAAIAATNASEVRHITVPATQSVEMVRFHPRKSHVLYGTREGTLYLADISVPVEKQGLSLHNDGSGSVNNCIQDTFPIRGATFLNNGNQVAYCTDDKIIRLVDIPTQKLFTPPAPLQTAAITDICSSSDGRKIISTSNDGSIAIIDAVSGKLIHRQEKAHSRVPVTSCQLSRSDQILLTHGMDSVARIFDLRKNTEEVTNFGNPSKSKHRIKARFTHTERGIICQSANQSLLHLFDVYSGAEQAVMSAAPHGHHCFAVAPEDLTVISGAEDRCLHMWGVALRDQAQ